MIREKSFGNWYLRPEPGALATGILRNTRYEVVIPSAAEESNKMSLRALQSTRRGNLTSSFDIPCSILDIRPTIPPSFLTRVPMHRPCSPHFIIRYSLLDIRYSPRNSPVFPPPCSNAPPQCRGDPMWSPKRKKGRKQLTHSPLV